MGKVRRVSVKGRDCALHPVGADTTWLRQRPLYQRLALGYHRPIPAGAILFLEQEQFTGCVASSAQTRCVQEHQGMEARDFGLAWEQSVGRMVGARNDKRTEIIRPLPATAGCNS